MKKIILFLMLLTSSTQVYAREKLNIVAGNRGYFDVTFSEFAEKAGFFKQCDIDIDHFYTSGGAETLEALLAGKGDIATGITTSNALGAYQKNAPIKIIGSSMFGVDQVYYARSDSPINSVKDFNNKRIYYSTSGSFSYIIDNMINEKYKTNMSLVGTGNISSTFVAVMTDQIDIGGMSPPTVIPDVISGKVKIVAKAEELFPELKTQTVRVVVANNDSLNKKREAIKCWADSVLKSLDYFYGNEEGPKLYSNMTDISLDSIIYTMKILTKDHYTHITDISDDSLQQANIDGVKYKFLSQPLTNEQLKNAFFSVR